MFAKELLVEFGAAPLLIAFLIAFWKADDAFSAELRHDLSSWLKREVPDNINYPWVNIVRSRFLNVFGSRHFSMRCIATSIIFSIFLLITITFLVDQENSDINEFLNENRNFGYIYTPLIVLILNIIFDYISLLQTRYILNFFHENKLGVFLALFYDFLLTYLVASFSMMVGVYAIMAVNGLGEDKLLEIIFTLWDDDSPYIIEHQISMKIIAASMMTTFATSVWIWLAGIGILFIRLFSRIRPLIIFFQYALPLEEKPMRSIGVTGTFMVMIALVVDYAIS